jgi:hypothetical protein
MTAYIGHNNNKDYVRMDKDAEPIGNDTSNTKEALFYVVRTTRGSLKKGALILAKENIMLILFVVFENVILSYHGIFVVDMKSPLCFDLSYLDE